MLDGFVSEQDSPAISASAGSGGYFIPLYRDGDLHRLNYDTLRTANINFLRILDVVSQPLSFQQTEELVYDSQREVVALLRTLIERQNQQTTELRSAVFFFGECHEQALDEKRQLRNDLLSVHHEVEQVRADHQLFTVEFIF